MAPHASEGEHVRGALQPPPARDYGVWPYVSLGAGAALWVASGAAFLMNGSLQDDIDAANADKRRGPSDVSLDDIRDLESKRDAWLTGSVVSFTAGAIALGAGACMYLTGVSSPAIVSTPDGAAASLRF